MSDIDDKLKGSCRSQLFTIRFWLEDLGRNQADWRGKVQHVNSGEARYFRRWSALEIFIKKFLLKNNHEDDIGEEAREDNVDLQDLS
jgi:hypothetical protein